MNSKTLSIRVSGVVQGVGFRPHVYNLATRFGLSGWVLNSSDGVFCVVQGEPDAVDGFVSAIRNEAPPMAVIDSLIAEEIDPQPFDGFEIRESARVDGAMTLVSPDIATCEACIRELFDPNNRRYRYPFINCTNCGPRFTIIDDVPYDRPSTTMRVFSMCSECAEEYNNPADRRFHAQPNACFVCGPRLYLVDFDSPVDPDSPNLNDAIAWSPSVETEPRPHRNPHLERKRSDTILARTAQLLQNGRIVAVKGLGGFHLACDATNEEAVQRLRERKNRWGKPLAIMVPSLDTLRAYCEITAEEEALLCGTVRPIVLLRRRKGVATPLAEAVSGDLPEIGVMLPYTPLHHLLLSAVDRPLVMTSGNLSEEPIATDNSEALRRLGNIADAFLLHDRDIHSRYDDSVLRIVDKVSESVRRARGYAPFPLPMPGHADIDILAVGPEQKNTFTLVKGEHAFVSQHIGDMENRETLEHFEQTIMLYQRLFRIDPTLVAHDLHPEYLSTKFALTTGLPRIGVQHHHAHIVSITAEHNISDTVIGIAFDGTGYGTDGHIWGGEVLLADWQNFERVAHLAYVPMPGGAAAIRRPARMAVGTLYAFGLLDHPGAEPLRARLADGEEQTLRTMVNRNVNCPLTSSMGRLFDTVAAITGVRDDAAYEGEAAIELEACADPTAKGTYSFEFRPGEDVTYIDPRPVLLEVLEDVEAGRPASEISMRFHRAVVCAIVKLTDMSAKRTGIRNVALAGGVFMNRLVLAGALLELREAGFTPLTHLKLPTNDGAVSFGQAIVAWARRRER